MELKEFEGYGREIMVKFTCRRCRVEAYKPLKDCLPNDCSVRGLYDLIAPANWRNGGFYYATFCPECAVLYDKFLKGEY